MSTDADAPSGREREGPKGLLIDARGLSVQYAKGLLALDDLSLRLEPGVHGLLGANGAGKSTLIKVLLGLLKPTAGEVSVLGLNLGEDPRLVRQRVGYMPERDAHVPMMSAIDYVTLFGEISGLDSRTAMKRAHEVLHYVELGEARYRSVEGFSAGMRQRLKLAAAIVHDPDLLFLDEPTNGLDPDGRRDMLDLVRELGRSGISVVLSTHLLPDVQEVCSSVVFVHRGKVRRTGAVKDLTHGLKNLYVVSFQGEAAPFLAALNDQNIQADYDETSGRLRLTTPEGAGTQPILEAAVLAGVGIERLLPGTRSLEEVFFSSIDQKEHSYADS